MDTVHALVDPETAPRELFYVAMTPGKQNNSAHVIQPDPHDVETHLEPPEPLTRIGQLHRVLAREAQVERVASYLDVAPFPEGIADEVFTSPHYEQLEAAVIRHEAAGHAPTRILARLAPRLQSWTEEKDPAAWLASMIDAVTTQLPRRKTSTPGRVAGLIPRPTGPLDDDMRVALQEREDLITTAAAASLDEAIECGAAWVAKLGKPGPMSRERQRWRGLAVRIALYRRRYDIHESAPLGDPDTVASPQQAAERRIAQIAHSRLCSQPQSSSSPQPDRKPAQRALRSSL